MAKKSGFEKGSAKFHKKLLVDPIAGGAKKVKGPLKQFESVVKIVNKRTKNTGWSFAGSFARVLTAL